MAGASFSSDTPLPCAKDLLSAREVQISEILGQLNVPSPQLPFSKAFVFQGSATATAKLFEAVDENEPFLDWLQQVYVDAAIHSQRQGTEFVSALPFQVVDTEFARCSALSRGWCWLYHGQSSWIRQNFPHHRLSIRIPKNDADVPWQKIRSQFQRRYHFTRIDRARARSIQKLDGMLANLHSRLRAEAVKCLHGISDLIEKVGDWTPAAIRINLGGFVNLEVDLGGQPSPLEKLPDLDREGWIELLKLWKQQL